MHLHFRRRDLAPLGEPRVGAAVIPLPDGRVIVAGGGTRRAGEPRSAECEVHCRSTGAMDVIDVARGTTRPLSPLRSARESATGTFLKGRVLIAGGLADNG